MICRAYFDGFNSFPASFLRCYGLPGKMRLKENPHLSELAG